MAAPKPAPRPDRRSWFELVRSDAGWHVRLVGTNGEIVMSSEVYVHRVSAQAVFALCRGAINRPEFVDERTRDSKGGAGPVSEGEAGTGPAGPTSGGPPS